MMSFGDLISAQWQVQWRGQLIGWPATNLAITNVTGWLDLPNLRSTPTDRPGRHGAFASILRASSRSIEVDIADVGDDATAFRSFVNITSPGEDDDEEPLVIWLDDQPYLVNARCEKRSVPTDQQWSLGYRRATFVFQATDPRRYSITQTSNSIGLAIPGTDGLVFPLVFPLTFGTLPIFAEMTLTTAGAIPTWPTYTITGPVTGPIITNPATGDQLAFDPALVVGAGQTLVIDTDLRTVALEGVTRRNSLWTADWAPLYPGIPLPVVFTSVGAYDPAASLEIAYSDAWF